MSLLFDVLYAARASGTHHKLAMDALLRLRHHDAERWRNLFLNQIDQYLEGSKAPDTKFKDFRNHVLHVSDNYWGGAPTAARQWYGKFVIALRERDWLDAAYAAGVTSHYVTDPFMPFHTGQSEAEGVVHRAAEWSVTKSYDQLRPTFSHLGSPSFDRLEGKDWLEQLVCRGADLAHPHYQFLIDHYDIHLGVKNPPAGFDDEARVRIAEMLSHAAVAVALVLDRAFEEANVEAPYVFTSLQTVFETLTVPIRSLTKNLANEAERVQVELIYKEYVATGKVVVSLSDDEKTVRTAYAKEVLGVSLKELDRQPIAPPGSKYGQIESIAATQARAVLLPTPEQVRLTIPAIKPGRLSSLPRRTFTPTSAAPPADVAAVPAQNPAPARIERPIPTTPSTPPVSHRRLESSDDEEVRIDPPQTTPVRDRRLPNAKTAREPRYLLKPDMPIEAAPTIGPKMAQRMESFGYRTVADLLRLDPAEVARQLKIKNIDADDVKDWQAQARLVCDVPELRGHDAQILVACGIRTRLELQNAALKTLFTQAREFASSSAGRRILRGADPPDEAEVQTWIANAARTPLSKPSLSGQVA